MNIVEKLKEFRDVMGFDRMRLIEYSNSKRVIIEVPRRHLVAMEYVMTFNQSSFVETVIRPLAFWRCWFRKVQHIVVPYDL